MDWKAKSLTAVILAVAIICVPASQAAANDYPSTDSVLDHRGNSSLLVGVTSDPDRLAPSFHDWVLDRKYAAQMRQDFDMSSRNHEIRERHALVDRYEQKSYFDHMSGMAHEIVDHIQHEQAKDVGNRVKTALEREPGARKPLEVVVVALAIYSGKPVKLRAAQDVTVSLVAQVAKRAGSVSMVSPLGDTRADFEAGSADRMKLVYSKAFPFWDMSGAVAYGTGTQDVVASLSKAVTRNLSVVYESHLRTEETYRLAYGLAF